MSGLTHSEAKGVIAEINPPGIGDFELSQITAITPNFIRRISNLRLSRSLVIWALLKRLINNHNLSCVSEIDEFVQVNNGEILKVDIPLTELNLSNRTINALTREGFKTTFQLSKMPRTQLMKIRNLGIESINEIYRVLEKSNILDSVEPINRQNSFLLNSNVKLENIGFSTRTYNAFQRMGIKDLTQIAALTDYDLRDIRNFGEKSIQEVKTILAKYMEDKSSKETSLVDSSLDIGELYDWAKIELINEIEQLEKALSYIDDLGLEYHYNSFGGFEFNPNLENDSNLNKYLLSDTLGTLKQNILSATGGQIEPMILSLDSVSQDFLSYTEFRLTSYPSQGQKESLLEYENKYSDDALDLLEFDKFTLNLLGIASSNAAKFLGQKSYFDLLEIVSKNLITDKDVWDIVGGVVSFHQKYRTYPNILGLVIAYHLGESNTKVEVIREFSYLLDLMQPNNSQRNLTVLKMRIEGATLDEIGSVVGVTRERIRQILEKIAPNLNLVIDAVLDWKKQEKAEIELKKFDEIFIKYGAIYKSELSKELGLSELEAIRLTPKKYQKYIIDKEPEKPVSLTWTREDCYKALRKASTYFFPIRQADYDYLINIGEVKGPSIAYMYLKHGQWSELCAEAGVECVPSVRTEYVRMWSDDELLSFAKRFLKVQEIAGSYDSYDAWREKQPDHVPSGMLLRNVFGNWKSVKRKALESIRKEKGLEVQNGI